MSEELLDSDKVGELAALMLKYAQPGEILEIVVADVGGEKYRPGTKLWFAAVTRAIDEYERLSSKA